MKNNRQLKSLLINPRFQISVIYRFMIIGLVVNALLGLAMRSFFNNLRAQGVAAGLAPDHPLFNYIGVQEAHFHAWFLAVAVASILIIVGGGIWISHRVAGPLHRLTEHLRAAVPGATVRFRDGDYFHELQDAFNDFVGRSK